MKNLTWKELGEMKGSVPLHDYERIIKDTDRFLENDLNPILLGLYGEIGSIMSASKKYHREKKAYAGYKEAVEEEFGDALWYFTALCGRFRLSISEIFEEAADESGNKFISASDQVHAPISQLVTIAGIDGLDRSLIELGSKAARLLELNASSSDARTRLVEFARIYIQALQSTNLSFAKIIKSNVKKTFGRFLKPDLTDLPDFDMDFPEEEQLPRYFEIHILQRNSGQTYMRWNGVFIGSPLTDNIKDPDGYRFHDVFHFAHAAILHWSPTFRALIKQKRKSDPSFDEAQDGGRAIVVEEGLTAWIYSYAKGLDYFEGHDGVSFDVLKTIQKFIQGYEVEECPLKLWEDAIIQGYSVFRKVKENKGGIIIGDRSQRTLTYRVLEK
ncbi:nucleoside triphosphate pyrophosphohydrolase family protein [Pseudoalteromonas piscicida]|uniref:nucleoside triphosphate pyrophosphohydrolase family protein n=1 Tax=Pseudoalteromonas piscicida TaxID=43662 RepID=UPI0030C963F6